MLGDISDLSQFYDESFDCLVFLNGALSHVVDYKNAIRGFYRVLGRGGVLIVMLYSRYSISRILRMSFMRGSGIYKIRNSRGGWCFCGVLECAFCNEGVWRIQGCWRQWA